MSRLTEEQLQAIQERIKRGSVVRTNQIALPSEKRPIGLKYGNKRTERDGETFDSAREAERYGELKLLEFAGEIHDLNRQVPFRCVVNGQEVCKYIADFVYKTVGNRIVVEDAKGYATAIYKLKKKLVKACLNIEVIET